MDGIEEWVQIRYISKNDYSSFCLSVCDLWWCKFYGLEMFQFEQKVFETISHNHIKQLEECLFGIFLFTCVLVLCWF